MEGSMSRRLFPVLLFLLFVSSYVLAQEEVKRTGGYARVVSLGNNPYIIDPEAIKVNPAWAYYYYDFLWGDIGSNAGDNFGNASSGQFAGVNFAFSKNITLGLMLTRNDFNTFSIGKLDPLAGYGPGFSAIQAVPGAIPLNNNVEIFSSLKLNNFIFGLGVAFAVSKNNTKQPNVGETDIAASQAGLNGGIIYSFARDLMLDAGVSFIFPSASNEPPAPGVKISASQTLIGINARLFWRYSPKVRFVPAFYFINGNGSQEVGNLSGDLNSLTSIGFGIGVEYTVGDFLLVGGPGINSNSWKIPGIAGIQPELSNSSIVFPIWNLGAEWAILDWMTARIGYTASTSNITTQTGLGSISVRENTVTQYSPGIATLGVGLKLGDFSLDATINADVLRQGLGNIGGGRTFAYISTSYAF
jgi:hypothetical protein